MIAAYIHTGAKVGVLVEVGAGKEATVGTEDFQQLVRMVPIGESLAQYVVNLVRATRHNSGTAPDFVKKYVNYGASVRAAQFIVLSAKARALAHRTAAR